MNFKYLIFNQNQHENLNLLKLQLLQLNDFSQIIYYLALLLSKIRHDFNKTAASNSLLYILKPHLNQPLRIPKILGNWKFNLYI